MKGLSVFEPSRRPPHLMRQRPFSAVLQQMPKEMVRQEQIEEIDDIKHRIAMKKNIKVPICSLTNALLVPTGFDTNDKLGLFPKPGCMLFDNIFAKKKKKKKGKKGKKGKKKKKSKR